MGRDSISVEHIRKRYYQFEKIKKAELKDDEGNIISFDVDGNNRLSKKEIMLKKSYYDLGQQIGRKNKEIKKINQKISYYQEQRSKFENGAKKPFFSFGPSNTQECEQKIQELKAQQSSLTGEITETKNKQQKFLSSLREKQRISAMQSEQGIESRINQNVNQEARKGRTIELENYIPPEEQNNYFVPTINRDRFRQIWNQRMADPNIPLPREIPLPVPPCT